MSTQETTGQKLLRLRKQYGISRRTVAVIIDVCEMSIMRAELLPDHQSHPHIEKQMAKVCEILESRLEVEKGEST
jgi:DNA-binding XRE family transcriptional regulator